MSLKLKKNRLKKSFFDGAINIKSLDSNKIEDSQ